MDLKQFQSECDNFENKLDQYRSTHARATRDKDDAE